MENTYLKKILKLIASIILCLFAGFVGSIFTTPKISTWYQTLVKPEFNPPNWIFGPVWTTLFILMGIALYLVWVKESGGNKKTAVVIFFIQLALNILWSLLFFGLTSPLAAFIEIILLWIFILVTMIRFYKISKLAGLLFVPYFLWVSFASILNLFIWQLNR